MERLGEAVLDALSFMELPLMSHPNKLVYLRLENVQGDYHTLGGPSLLEPKSTLICTPLPKVKAFLATAGQDDCVQLRALTRKFAQVKPVC